MGSGCGEGNKTEQTRTPVDEAAIVNPTALHGNLKTDFKKQKY